MSKKKDFEKSGIGNRIYNIGNRFCCWFQLCRHWFFRSPIDRFRPPISEKEARVCVIKGGSVTDSGGPDTDSAQLYLKETCFQN